MSTKKKKKMEQIKNEPPMTIPEWLKDVYFDPFGTYLWSKQSEDGGSQMIGEVRGWGALQNVFPNEVDAASFQDEIGKFIADAINEKVARLKTQSQNI